MPVRSAPPTSTGGRTTIPGASFRACTVLVFANEVVGKILEPRIPRIRGVLRCSPRCRSSIVRNLGRSDSQHRDLAFEVRTYSTSSTPQLSCKGVKLNASKASFQRSLVIFSVRYTAGRRSSITRSLHVRYGSSSLYTYLLNHSVFDMGSAIWRRSHADQHVLPRSQIRLKEDVHPGRDHRDTTRQ